MTGMDRMSQDRQSGAAGNNFGRTLAPKIAQAIGAKINGPRSNKSTYNGESVVIKGARVKTSSVGVTYKMLEEITAVIGAFEQKDGDFKVLLLPVATFRINIRASQSKGPSAGKVGLVSRRVFYHNGISLGTVQVRL
jgi:hypothetical protein